MTGLHEGVTGFADQGVGDLEPRWLTREEVVALHEKQLARFGGPSGIRELGLLESALDRPRNKWAYEGADLALLAAAYAYGIARNHPFVDGNKRAAFVAMMLFLRLNGVFFRPSQAEATQAMLELAAGNISEDGFARWIRDRLSGV
jgi:death-on-curing protein